MKKNIINRQRENTLNIFSPNIIKNLFFFCSFSSSYLQAIVLSIKKTERLLFYRCKNFLGFTLRTISTDRRTVLKLNTFSPSSNSLRDLRISPMSLFIRSHSWRATIMKGVSSSNLPINSTKLNGSGTLSRMSSSIYRTYRKISPVHNIIILNCKGYLVHQGF